MHFPNAAPGVPVRALSDGLCEFIGENVKYTSTVSAPAWSRRDESAKHVCTLVSDLRPTPCA